MIRHTTWVEGPHHALVWGRGAALLPDTVPLEAALTLWEQLEEHSDFSAFVQGLVTAAGGTLATLPAFAAAVVVEEGTAVQVAVRGDFVIRQGDTTVEGARISTWTEHRFGVGDVVTMHSAGQDDAAGPTRPMVAGIAPARHLTLHIADVTNRPAEPVGEATGEPVPRPALAPGQRMRRVVDSLTDPGVPAQPQTAVGVAVPPRPAPAPAPPTDVMSADEVAQAIGGPVNLDKPVGAPSSSMTAAETPGLTTPSPSPSNEPGWHDDVHDVTKAAHDDRQDHDRTVIRPDGLRGLTPASPPPHQRYGVLHSTTGLNMQLTGTVVIGRAPRDHGDGVTVVRLALAHLSAEHLEIRADRLGVYALDLGSRNGTTLRAADGSLKRLNSDPARLRSGDVLDLGLGVRLILEDLTV